MGRGFLPWALKGQRQEGSRPSGKCVSVGVGTGRPVGSPATGWGTGPPRSHALSATYPGSPEGRPRPLPSGRQNPPQGRRDEVPATRDNQERLKGPRSPPATKEPGCTCYPGCPQKESLRVLAGPECHLKPSAPPPGPSMHQGPEECATSPLRHILAQGGPPGRLVSRQTRKVWVGTATE